MLGPDDWRCPTCLDLCFKPAVNSACGHVFCFWCVHRAMSPYAPSACPICRTKYSNLPAICAKLHCFLNCQFPEVYAQRREETEAEEAEYGAASPEPQADASLPPPAAPGQWCPQHFCCDNPACGQLLCRPAVLNCGHAVCQPTCLGRGSPAGGSSTGAGAGRGLSSAGGAEAAASGAGAAGVAAVAAGAGAGRAAGAKPPAAPCRAGQAGSPAAASGAGAAAAYECPACGLAARQLPAVCKQLGDLLLELFPEEYRQREAECQQEVAARQATAAAAAAGAAAAVGEGEEEEEEGEEEEEPSTPRAAAAAGDAAEQDSGPEDSAALSQQGQAEAAAGDGEQQAAAAAVEQEQEGHPQSLSPSLTSALRRRQAAGGAQQALAERLERTLRRMAEGEDYAWHGVGCDGCGQYPILGRRYQCRDCPDAMGFDLCGACMDRGLGAIVGRFNQRHLPDHRMHLVRPRMTAMHMLQAANPELPMEQLMWLLEMAMADPEEEGDRQEGREQAGQQGQGQEAAAEGGPQGQRGQQQQQQQLPQQGSELPPQQPLAGGSNGQGAGQAAGGGGPAGAAAGEAGELLPVLRRGPRPAYDPSAQEPSPSAYAPQQQQQERRAAAGGEAAALIEEEGQAGGEEEDQLGSQMSVGEGEGEGGGEAAGSVTAVHVPLEAVLRGLAAPQGPANAPAVAGRGNALAQPGSQ